MEKEKKEEELGRIVDIMSNDGDTVFIIDSIGDDGSLMFTGEPLKVGLGLASILDNGLSDDAVEYQHDLAMGVIIGLVKIIRDGGQTFNRLMDILDDAMKEGLCSDGEESHVFELVGRKCLMCSSYEMCMKRILSKVGVDVAVRRRDIVVMKDAIPN